MTMKNPRVVIIGGGFAGASCAWHLTQRNIDNVIVLEREDLPGMHASGLNASMIRQFGEDATIVPLKVEGARFAFNPPRHWGEIVGHVGSLLLFKKKSLKEVEAGIKQLKDLGVDSKILDPQKASQKIPLLEGADFDYAVWTPSDGVADINTFLWMYIRDAKEHGARLELKQTVESISRKGEVFVVKTERGVFEADILVNASGAWASEVAALAGGRQIKIQPYRRHLYNTIVMDWVDPNWPFVWDIENQYYFRPESGGLLLGPADEDPSEPCVPSTSHEVRELLAEKLSKFCPRLANVTIAKEWAGLRTFAADRRFVLGEDPTCKNFYWAVALGGFGVTTSYSVGRIVVDAIIDRKKPPAELDVARF